LNLDESPKGGHFDIIQRLLYYVFKQLRAIAFFTAGWQEINPNPDKLKSIAIKAPRHKQQIPGSSFQPVGPTARREGPALVSP
jgi:hypothetical protein